MKAIRLHLLALLGGVCRPSCVDRLAAHGLPAAAEGRPRRRQHRVMSWCSTHTVGCCRGTSRLIAGCPRYSQPAPIWRSRHLPSFSITRDSVAKSTNERSSLTCAISTRRTRRTSSSPRPTKRWTSCSATGRSCLRRFRSCTCPFRRSTCDRQHRCRLTSSARRWHTTSSAPSNRRCGGIRRADRIFIVTGASPWDMEWEARVREQAAGFPSQLSIEFMTGLPAAVLQRQLRDLPADSIVFTLGFFRDGGGREFTPREASQLIAAASSVPVYGPFSTFMGTGIVGGRMASYDAIGRLAAETAIKLLDGTSPDSLRLPAAMPTPLQVDWRQLRALGHFPASGTGRCDRAFQGAHALGDVPSTGAHRRAS